jgi:ATP-binding cassette, subfamily B, bacterial PglK
LIGVYRKLLTLLNATERTRCYLVCALLVVVAFVEVLGVASIMPFIAILMNPGVVESNPYLAFVYAQLGFSSIEAFLLFVGVVFVFLLFFSLGCKAVGTWAQLRFSHNRIYTWGARLVGGYLRQPYEWFLNRHSADLATSVLAEVNQVVHHGLLPAMQIIANGLVVIFLMVLLILVDPVLAFAVGGLLGVGYAAIYAAMRRRLTRIGRDRMEANQERFHIVSEAFGGVKEVKIAGLEEVVVNRFLGPSRIMAKRMISVGLIEEVPSLAMQGLLFGGMLLALLYLMATHGGVQDAIPVVALYAFAGYRLMPAIKAIYRDVSQLRYAEPVIDALSADFASLQTTVPQHDGGARIPLQRMLSLRKVSYSYPGAPGPALRSVSMNIRARTTIGLVGSTGSGKTTTVDLILGLLRPVEGALVVDDIEITGETVRSWQRSLGYVPQQIFLSDNSIAANIAFGLPPEAIDMAAVENAARIANLHEFITSELPDGYQTSVGERGVRLSGGQRQRIGIARALYHDPDVLIMDEATSALDNITERAVMEAVSNIGQRKTIILIAHRLSTVRNCDQVFLLEHGEVAAFGTYDELVAKDERFRAMADIA